MPTAAPTALGIDVGSTNTKVCLVEADGRPAAAASRSLHTESDGEVATQDPQRLWEAVLDAVCEVVAGAPDAAARVAAVGVCSQYSSVVPVDADGAPVGPLVMWMDTRGTDRCWDLMGRQPDAFDVWVERHGIPPVGAGLTLAHLLHLQHEEPELHAATAAYLEPMDYVTTRLTGRITANQGTMFAAQLCDNRVVGTTHYDDELLDRSGVDPSRLPPLIGVDELVGVLAPEVAAATGLPGDAGAWAAMNDSHAGAFATGAFEPGTLGLMVGTTAVLLDTVGHAAVDLDHEVVSMPAPLRGRYLVWAENGLAGRSVDHALGLLGAGFDDLEAALERAAPGAGGVLFLPWLAGSLSPSANRSMRGGWIGVGLETGRDDLLRAAVEGTARNLRWLLPHVEAFSGQATERVVFGGGAARSRGWGQVVADVLGRPVDLLAAPGTAAAAAVAAVALDRHLGRDPLDRAPRIAERLEPRRASGEVHDRLQPHFEAAFEATRSICEALHPVR